MADKKKVEAGREKLAAYVKKKNASPPKKEKRSKKETLQHELRASSSSSAVLDSEVLGITIQSSDSLGSINDRDTERLSIRIKELEEILAGKDTALAALREELNTSRDMSADVSTGMLSFGLETDYKTHLERYQTRLEEFEAAVLQRDDLIRQLSQGLQAANKTYASKEEQTAQGIALLERQLHAATQMVQGYSWDTGINPHEYLTMQNKMLALEDDLNKNKSIINELNIAVKSKDQEVTILKDATTKNKLTIDELNELVLAKDQELNQKAQELTQHKAQAAKEVQVLMRDVEELSQRCALSTSNISLDETALRCQLEEDFGLQLAQIKEELRIQLNNEYTAELDSYKEQLQSSYLKCLQATAVEDKLTTELASYEVELMLQKEQSEKLKSELEALSQELVNSKQAYLVELSSNKQKNEDFNKDTKQASTLRAQVETLKNNLILAKENAAKELRQCQQSHIKELDLIKAQNATLEMELDNLTRNEGNCAAELNACKEAFIAQFGVNKHTAEMEVVALKQQVHALTVQLKESITLNSVSDLGSQQDILEKELKEIHDAKVDSLNEIIENLSHQVKEALTAQETLTAENMGYMSQIETYKEWLKERTKVEEGHGKDVVELQKELNSCKHQVEEVEEKHSLSILSLNEVHSEEIKKLNEQISTISKNKEEYASELVLLRDEVHSLKKNIDEVVNVRENIAIELEASRTAVDNFKLQLADTSASSEKLQTANVLLLKRVEDYESELMVFKERLEKTNVEHQIEMAELQDICKRDVNQVRSERKIELDSLNQQVQELNKDLAKGSLDEEISVEHKILDDSISVLREEINTLKKWIHCREESYGSLNSQLLDTVVKLESMQAMLRGKEELEISMQERDGELSQANMSLKDIETLLEKRIRELETLLLEATNETYALKEGKLQLERHLQHSEALLIGADKDVQLVREKLQETEAKLLLAETLSTSSDDVLPLKTRIEELEGLLRQVNVEAMKAERDSMIAQVVKSKDDIVASLRKRIEELQASLREVNVDSQSMKAESDRMTAQVAKARELLRRSKTERDELCKRHDGEMEQLKRQLQVQGSGRKTDNLEHLVAKLDHFEKEHEELVSKCSVYEEEVQQLRAQLANSESSLEDMRQEICNNKAPVIEHVRQERRETVSSNQLSMMGLSFMGNTFFNENNNSAFMNMSEYLEVAGVNSNHAVLLIENCNQLESVRHELETNVEHLQAKLREKELGEELYKEEIAVAAQRYKELENSVTELKQSLNVAERNIVSQSDLENKLIEMETMLKMAANVQDNLRSELLNKQMIYEDKIQQTLREQLSESVVGGRNVEEIICELGGKAKEVVVLSEKLRLMAETEDTLNARIMALEEGNQRYANQVVQCISETGRVQEQLEVAWQSHRCALDDLSKARRELALSRLSNEHLEKSQARLNETTNTSILDDAKMALLQSAVIPPVPILTTPIDASRSGKTCDQESLIDSSVSDLRARLEHILNSGSDHSSTSTNPTNLMAELSFYREQHASLAEILGSTGVLQEALHRQKTELVHKLEEKAVVERSLECERVKLANTEFRLRLLEQQTIEKDNLCVELSRQKRLMEQDLREIEERLREQEDDLLQQRTALETEIRERDVRIKHWQMQYRTKQLELSHRETSPQLATVPPAPGSPDRRLDEVRRDLDMAHQQATRRLKTHLHEVFSVRETQLSAQLSQQLVSAQEQHTIQLANQLQEFEAKLHKLESTKLSDSQREKLDVDLDEMKIKLDEREKEIYAVLRQKFELFAEQQVNRAIERIQSEHEIALGTQTAFHKQELDTLQAKMTEQRQTELLAVQQDLLEQHKRDLQETQLRFKNELIRLKRTPTSYPTDSKSATELLKQLICNEFTASFQSLSEARYTRYHQQLRELTTRLEAAMSDDGALTTADTEQLLNTQEELLNQTQGLLEMVVLEHSRMLEALGEHLDIGHSQLLTYLDQTIRDANTAVTVTMLRDQLAALEQEKQQITQQHELSVDQLTKDRDEVAAKMEQLLAVAGVECGPCVYLRKELETKHKREMEELRQYFEQKCADVEKHYSEEIFSQHSRKLSTGSSSCENELVSDLCYPSGDHVQRVNTLTHVCNPLDASYKDVEDECRRDYEQRLVEYRDQLEVCKRDLEKKYRAEMEALKVEYEARVEQLVRDLTSNHHADLKQLEDKHSKDLDNIRQQANSEQGRSCDFETAHAQQLADLKSMFEQKLAADIEKLTDQMLLDEAEHIELVKAELNEKHAKELQQAIADKAEAKQFAEASRRELFEKEEKHKRDIMKQLQALLAEKDEGKFGTEYRKQLADLEAKHQAEIECERNHIAEQVEEYTAIIKMGAEQEQDKFMKVQKDIMSSFLLQHKQDVQLLTEQYEAQLCSARDEIRKLQSEQAEYDELITQSKRRLHAEVQHDVVRTLDEQLQALLSEDGDTSACPPELLQLQDKFSARYKRELAALKQELADLKQQQPEATTSTAANDESQVSYVSGDLPAGKDRAELRQMAATMKSLVSELAKYVTVCEDELNNTLVEQILKYDIDSRDLAEPSIFRDAPDMSSMSNGYGELPYMSIISNLDVSSNKTSGSTSNDVTMDASDKEQSLMDTPTHKSSSSSSSRRKAKVRRVHFAPNMSNMINMDEDNLIDYIDKHKALPADFREELDNCLERLKSEAAALLGSNILKRTGDKSDLSHHVELEASAREDLTARLVDLQAYKIECERLESLVASLSSDLGVARGRVTELEAREDVTEGYGEQGQSSVGRRIKNLADLQEQARSLLSEGGVKPTHVHLIEELCREGDRLVEESKQEREDLQLQVDAADKQLRSTRQFLEEQAMEREQERDEYTQQIVQLQDQIKVNEGHRSDLQRHNKEDLAHGDTNITTIVETLEVQVKEATSLLKEAESKKEELETELKAAVDKVWVLRDIISELESQVEIKSQNEATLEQQLHELQALLEQQSQNNQELTHQLDAGQSEMTEQICQLEEQLRIHRQQMEQYQPDSVKQMKTTLRDFETTLDRKTKDLESLYTTTRSDASSPSASEEISIREQIDVMRCATPDEAPPSLPLNQLLRLQDKLQVHSRAEQAALKKIRDLEMHIKTMQYEENEVVAERDVLQSQVQEQLLKISQLQSNVEEQRSKADNIIQQASTELNKRLHDRELEARDLKQEVENKEKQLADVQVVLEQTRLAVAAQEQEWTARVKKEQEAVVKLKMEYTKLKEDIEKEKEKEEQEVNFEEDGGATGRYVPVSALIDSLQATKNAQIDMLAKQVADLENLLEAYRHLDLTDEQRAQLETLLKGVKTSKKVLNDSKSKKMTPIASVVSEPGISSTSAEGSNLQATPFSGSSTTQVLFKRDDDKLREKGAEERAMDKCKVCKESTIESLRKQLAAKDRELAEKDRAMRGAMESVENVSGRLEENSELRKQMDNYQAEIDTLKSRSSEEIEDLRIENMLMAENIAATAHQLQRKSECLEDVLTERDMMRMRLEEYENMGADLDELKSRANEADMLRSERDMMKERNDELEAIEAAYLKLLAEMKDKESVDAEKELYRSINDDQVVDQAMKDLELERDNYIRDLKEYECAIADQEDEIKRLLLMVEKLSTTTNLKEDRMEKGMSDLRLQLDNKDERISLLENQLAEERLLSKSLKDELNSLRSGGAQLRQGGKSSDDELMAQIHALQQENDALKVSLDALKGASGGDKRLEEELMRERQARMYAENMCRETVDKLEKISADKDKAMNAKIGAAAPSEKELLQHSEKKYEDEKKAKDMLQGVLDFTQDELESERAARRKLEERLKQLEQASAMDSKGSEVSRKSALDMANEMEQLKKQIKELQAENAELKKGLPSGATPKPSSTGADDGRYKELLMKIKDLETENADLKKGPLGATPKPSTTGADDGRFKELLMKIKDLEVENADLKKGLPSGTTPKPSTTGAGADNNVIVKDLEQKIRDLETENANLKKGPLGATAKPSTTGADDGRFKELLMKIKDLEVENADLKKGLPSGTTPKPSTTGAGADNNVIVKDLEKKIRDLEVENANLRKGLPLGGEETISQDKAAYGQLGAAPKSSTTGPDIIIKDLEKKIGDLEKKIRDLEAENANLKKGVPLGGEETIISADKAAYGQLGAAPKASSGFSNQDLEKRLKELEAENSKLKNTNDELEKNLKNRANELQAANDTLKNLQLSPDDRAKFDNELDAKNRAEKAEMEALIAQLEGQVKSFKNQDSGKSADSSGKLPGTNAEIDRLEKKCALLEAEIEKLKKEKTGLVDSYEHRIAGLTESFENRLKMRTKESMMRLHESIEKFKQTLSPEDHAANIIAVETKSVKSMAAMKEAYEKRIADIVAANSKDKETTNKVYNSNLSTLKETYERDIKMLNERHNASITQLQILHEEEVQEMNSELESEVKKLSVSEIEKVKKNQVEMVKSMKKRHQEEMENLKKKQKDKMNVEDDFKLDTSNQSGYDYNRAKLEYEAELQRMKDSNKNKIEVLKVKYTELMEEERRKNKGGLGSKTLAQSRTEVYELRPTDAGGEVNNQVGLRGQSPSVLGVEDILRKALAHGFESLTFDELSTLHERCCSSTARMIMENPALKLAPMKFTLQGADKQQLCSRIACLEQEIARRQFETQKRVNTLESTVKHEKRRLGEVKDALTRSLTEEQRRSLELHSRLGTQTQQQAEIESERDMLRRQLAYHEEKAKIAIQQLEKEKSKNRIMSEDLIKERNNIKHLQSLLEAERTRAKSSNLKESDLIETLRIKLETALDNEARMKFKYEKLEALYNSSQVPTNQRRLVSGTRPGTSPCAESCRAPCNIHCNDTCPAPCKAARLQDPYELQSKLEKERENSASLELSLRREQRKVEQIQALNDKEKQQTLQRIETEREKNKKLRRQVVALEEDKEALNAQLDTGRETLSSQQVLYENLERKLLDMQEADDRRRKRQAEEEEKNRLTIEQALTLQFEFEQKVLDLQDEVSSLKDQLCGAGDVETVGELRLQLAASNAREQQLIIELGELPKEPNISAPLLEKLKRMNAILEKHVEENSEVAVAMTQLTLDRQKLQERVRELEACLADRPDLSMFEANKMEIVNGLLASERSTWSREKAALMHELAKAESNKRSTDTSEAERVHHLFGKYLRVESYRKALIWQKRYLLVVISGYQDAEDKTVARLAKIARLDNTSAVFQDVRSTKNDIPINKFRCCVKAVVAIHRMQFLVRRWSRARSIGGNTVLNRGSANSVASGQSSYYGPRRSASNVWSVPHGGSSQLAYSPTRDQFRSIGLSSLSRDQHMLRRWEMEQTQQNKLPETTSGVPPVKVDEYLNRFDQIQQKLGLAVAHHPT